MALQPLDQSTVRSWTIDSDPLVFPCRRLHVAIDGGHWWEIRYLWAELARQGCITSAEKHRSRWIHACTKILQEQTLFADLVLVHPASSQPGHVNAATVSTVGLIYLYFVFVDSSRLESKKACFQQYLREVCNAVGRVCRTDAGLDTSLGENRFSVPIRNGQVHNWLIAVNSLHSLIAPTFKKCWHRLRGAGTLQGNLEDPVHSLEDICTFAANFLHDRRQTSKNHVSKGTLSLVSGLQRTLIVWLASALESYLRTVYMPNHDCSGPAPQLTWTRPVRDGRKYVQTDASQVWEYMEQAQRAGCSLRQVLRMKATPQQASPCQASVWTNKALHIYFHDQQPDFTGCLHLNIVADAATHNNKEVFVGAAYSHEKNNGTYPPFQYITPGKLITPFEQDLGDAMLRLSAQGKLERVAAFRQLQALSHMSFQVTGRNLWDYTAPGLQLRPVALGEVRILRSQGGRQRAFLVNVADKQLTAVLGEGLEEFPLLVAGLDQGSVGAAGMAFAEYQMQAMVWTNFDKFHRLVRDMKLSFKYAARGLFLKTQIFTSFIWSLNYKPFNSGAFFTKKQQLLEVFLGTESVESQHFQRHWENIAFDLGLDTNDAHDVWRRLADTPTFSRKGALPKLGRWFSWNGVAEEQLQELSVLRMLLDWSSGSEADEEAGEPQTLAAAGEHNDPRAELRALQSAAGGFKLAHLLLTDELRLNARVLFAATQGLWTWYANQVQTIQTPLDALEYNIAMATSWTSHVQVIIGVLSDPRKLAFMNFTNALEAGARDVEVETQRAQELVELVWHLACSRSWSLSKHSCPPYSYALACSSTTEVSTRATTLMSADWRNLLRLEQLATRSPLAHQLLNDMYWTRSQPIRLLYILFERDQWQAQSRAGQRWLRGLLQHLPDNKLVEDIHSTIRKDSRANINTKLNHVHIQELVLASKTLERRSIQHKAVTGERFNAVFASTRRRSHLCRFKAQKHKLPQKWTAVMDKRTWPSPTPESALRSSAGWHWLSTYINMRELDLPVQVNAAWLSSFVRSHVVIQEVTTGAMYASLGNARWAVLACPLEPVPVCGQTFLLWPLDSKVVWLHVTDLSAWQVVPTAAISPLEAHTRQFLRNAISLQVTGGTIGLLQSYFLSKTSLTFKELLQLAFHLRLDQCHSKMSRTVLLQHIAQHVAADLPADKQSSYVDAVLALDQNPKQDELTEPLDDPLCEEAFNELPQEDQQELRDLKTSWNKRKDKEKLAGWRAARSAGAGSQPRRRRCSVAKAKAVATGAGRRIGRLAGRGFGRSAGRGVSTAGTELAQGRKKTTDPAWI